jgi:hypothetical protein
MRDQSHKDEMSSLLKADFARLRARGIATTLAQPAAEQSEDEAVEPLAGSGEESTVEPLAKSQEPAGDPEATNGWLKRLLRPS